MKQEISKTYEPKTVEEKILKLWEEGDYFKADPHSKKPPYSIVIPPPNVTGQLHIGHALNNTLQDVMVRFKRMSGFEVLWVPGSDHASISTEAKLVEALRNEGKTKEQVGREEYLRRAWEWTDKYSSRIMYQLKMMGCSCDYSRERFTLDEGCSDAVLEVFVRLYNKGLIYKGERLINYCPSCKTSISDAEVEHEEKDGNLYHVNYQLADGSGHLTIATTRPETMLGDTAVAVNGDDERYSAFVGKEVVLPLVGRKLPVIADSYVEKEFGTGALKITPGHDPNDYEIGQRHSLPTVNIIGDDGKINENGGQFSGLSIDEARKAVITALKEGDFLVKIEPHRHNVSTCERCSTPVEPKMSEQWFVSMKELAQPAIDIVEENEIQFIPSRFKSVYMHWLTNIRDWCISRQLWWGHRIPAYYCDDCGEIVVSKTAPEVCPKCGHKNLTQEQDTLDTWFSSAIWPFSVMGWPNETPEFAKFFPTDLLVTGYDIIFFWVVRMVFSSLEYTGKKPFSAVMLNGMIRDEQGRKMSKSLGNGVDPLELVDMYGADAMRAMLCTGTTPGADSRYSEGRTLASRNFANKIWNASRYILMNIPEGEDLEGVPSALLPEDKWVLSKLSQLIREANDFLERMETGMALTKMYDFIWDVLCDWYIELTKPRLAQGGEVARDALLILSHVLRTSMELLHPFMPFITEEIWQSIPGTEGSITVTAYPTYRAELDFPQEAGRFELVIEAIKGVRNARTDSKIPPSRKGDLYIATATPEVFNGTEAFFMKLASASDVILKPSDFTMEDAIKVVTSAAVCYAPLEGLVDREKELQRINSEMKAVQKEIDFLENRLGNEKFVAKAPAAVVEADRQKLATAKDKMEKLKEML